MSTTTTPLPEGSPSQLPPFTIEGVCSPPKQRMDAHSMSERPRCAIELPPRRRKAQKHSFSERCMNCPHHGVPHVSAYGKITWSHTSSWCDGPCRCNNQYAKISNSSHFCCYSCEERKANLRRYQATTQAKKKRKLENVTASDLTDSEARAVSDYKQAKAKNRVHMAATFAASDTTPADQVGCNFTAFTADQLKVVNDLKRMGWDLVYVGTGAVGGPPPCVAMASDREVLLAEEESRAVAVLASQFKTT